MVTKEILKSGFESLGLTAGMKIIVHSSLKSFGKVEGGADSVIDAICEIIGEDGTLMMPSFNHGEPYYNGDIFDVNKTPTTNGAIPETFRKREGVLRSINPTHPFADCLNNGAVDGIKCSDCAIRPRICQWSVQK